MKGVSIGHRERAVCLLFAFGVPGSRAGRNHRCSVPTWSGHCPFILSHGQAPSPEESWYLPFTDVKLKPQWGESRCFTTENVELWERGHFPWKRCSCFRLTLFQLPMSSFVLRPLEIRGEKPGPSKGLCRFFSRACKVQLRTHCSCHLYTVAQGRCSVEM